MTANFKPTQIQFGDKYEGEKLRRLSQAVADIGNRVAAVATTAAGSILPKNGSAGQVLTWLASTNAPGWAAPAAITSFPYSGLTGVPTSFSPSPHVVATTTGLGPAHTVSGLTPGQVLKATGTQQAAFGFLLYSELGDVDTTGLADGFVPAWSSVAGKWQMVANGASFSGLTPGYVYTATTPTTAQFLPLSVTPAQIGTGVPQYGLGAPMAPLRDTAGTKQWAQLNIPASDDTLLAGDGSWKAIRDISISWAQLSDVPAMLPPPPGARATAAFLRGDNAWSVLRANDLGTGTPQFGVNPQPSAPNRPLNGLAFRQLNLPQAADTMLTSLGWRPITDIDISWSQISNVPQQLPPLLGNPALFLNSAGGWSAAGGGSPLTTKGDLYTYSSVAARLPVGANGFVLSADSTQPTGLKWIAATGTGTVTSVGLADGSVTPIYAITGSPVVAAGTLTFTLANQLANRVFAGPASGGAAQPTFRALVAADIPTSWSRLFAVMGA